MISEENIIEKTKRCCSKEQNILNPVITVYLLVYWYMEGELHNIWGNTRTTTALTCT